MGTHMVVLRTKRFYHERKRIDKVVAHNPSTFQREQAERPCTERVE